MDDKYLEQQLVLVCHPRNTMPEPHVPGSLARHCDLCRIDVWLSPASARTMDAIRAAGRLTSVQCIACARAGYLDSPDLAVIEIEPDEPTGR